MYKYKAALNPPTPFHFQHEREGNQIVVFPIFLAARSVHLIHFWGTNYQRGNLVGALGRVGFLSHSKEGCYQPHGGQTFPSSGFKLGRHLCKHSANPTTTREGEDNRRWQAPALTCLHRWNHASDCQALGLFWGEGLWGRCCRYFCYLSSLNPKISR